MEILSGIILIYFDLIWKVYVFDSWQIITVFNIFSEFRDCFYLNARSGQIRSLDELTIIMRSLGMSPTITELKKYFKEKSELGVLFEVIISKFENFGNASSEHFIQINLSHYKTCSWNLFWAIIKMSFLFLYFLYSYSKIFYCLITKVKKKFNF